MVSASGDCLQGSKAATTLHKKVMFGPDWQLKWLSGEAINNFVEMQLRKTTRNNLNGPVTVSLPGLSPTHRSC
jgi:hypothetical protein